MASEGPPRVIELRFVVVVIIITTIYELWLLRKGVWRDILDLLRNGSVRLWKASNIDHDDRCLVHLLHGRLLLIEKVVVLRAKWRKWIDGIPWDQPLAISVSDAIL